MEAVVLTGHSGGRGWWGQARQLAKLGGLAVRLSWRASAWLLLGIVALLAFESALTPIELLLTRGVIDRIAAAESGPQLWMRIGLLAGALGLGHLIGPISVTFKALVGDRTTGYISAQLIEVTSRWQGLARFEDPSLADDVRRARKEASTGGVDVVVYGGEALVGVLTACGLAVVLAGLHPVVPVVMALASVPLMVRQWQFHNEVGSLVYILTPQSRQMEYAREVLTSAGTAKDVRVFGLGGFFQTRYDRFFRQALEGLTETRWRLTRKMVTSGLLAASVSAAVLVYVVSRVASGHSSVGDLVLYAGSALLLQGSLFTIGSYVGRFGLIFGFLPSLFRVLEASPDLPVARQPLGAPRPIRRGIEFENVWFSYPGRPTPVLRGVSFSLSASDSVALVGDNGSGKTTLVKLVTRLYDPTAGRILLDGHDLRDYDLEDLRKEMGVIFQDFTQYEFTVAENIGLGQVKRMEDRCAVLSAAHRSGADEVISRLPEGVETRVGREFGGRELSGGEWQKLALGRAFVRDAQVLVLDEPTASLDPQTEYAIYGRFAELTRNRLTILVSHRFSTVRMADHIVLLDGGRVCEEGSHDELLAADGAYARRYRMQASRYLDDGRGVT